MFKHLKLAWAVLFLIPLPTHAANDWPMLRGNPQHSGYVEAEIKGPFRLAWAREIEGERLGTAVEPIIAVGKVFIGTHAGRVYALRADSGEAVWRFQAHGAFLQSPAVANGLVLAGCTDGSIYALAMNTGELVWRCEVGRGGVSAAPIPADRKVYIGTRAGEFLALTIQDGKVAWRKALGIPVRQSAAVADGRVYVMAEDLKLRCFRAEDGELLWTSEQFPGQTARDYYPVVVRQGSRTYVIERTNPTLNMGQRIGRDRTLLCRNAGIDDSSWQKLDAYIKSDASRGKPELWAQEQEAITRYLETNRDARSFFVVDAQTGKETATAPVLWAAGCQAVGAPPALTADGRLLVFHRSAYGNWNHGVAPLVALGLLNLADNFIVPLFHQQGNQPRWNCFWGTADESQNFLVAGQTVLIIHQGTLSGFNLAKNELFPIWGERDTFGGFRNPPWARNEWHGPGRAGVAVVGNRIYWQTGSRLLCLVAGETAPTGEKPKPVAVGKPARQTEAPALPAPSPETLRAELNTAAETVLAQDWAPLFTDPGLAGREFSFDDSGEMFEALAWAYPHLKPELQAKAKDRLHREWREHCPVTVVARYPLQTGHPREYFRVSTEYRARLGSDRQPHPFGNVHVVWRAAQRCGDPNLVRDGWPQIKAAYDDFTKSNWKLDAAKGDLFANRYLASLLAIRQIAEQIQETNLAAQAQFKADETTVALLAWWQRAADRGTLKTFNTSSELDPFIGKGDGISLAMAPHRHKLALVQDLTPEVAALVRTQAQTAFQQVWATYVHLCPTWALTGEERQIHFGENFVDAPDLAWSSFRMLAFLQSESDQGLAQKVDLPFCRADLYYLGKLALALAGK